ncbi:MAG: MBL fold metallo-hydrolase [Deltaproteobacteria bacterium RBG_13_49_15]|nr:MAG: MBL fold metallo-hydrolase [Deltaproteobacteria bacterium RBG_13_49_15]
MKPIEIAKGIYDVGVTDWNIRDFHGYSTYMGTTYNAFLILDEKNVLIDTVKKEFADLLIENISSIIDPKKIDIIISNHTEMDHSGSLPRIMHRIGENKPLYCSQMGLKNLPRHFRQKWNCRGVENGERVSLGKRSLTFLETRMIHWPDSMFTYLNEDGILFSSDGFGQHYAGWEKFDDQIGDSIMQHAKKYFANILLLYSPKILKILETVSQMDIKINMICPDHGIIWRRDPGKIIRAYAEWSEQKPKAKALVIYDTMWQSTEKMAIAITEGLIGEGIETMPMHLRKRHRSDVMTEVLEAGAVVVGSPTLNNGLFPTVSDFLTYMKGLKPKNKIGQAFGSYGWSGESAKLVQEELEAMKFEIFEPGLRIQYVPEQEGIEACFSLGRRIGSRLKRLSQ